MVKIGIICEYNPFHNGHLYQIKKIKEMYPDSTLIIVMSGNFTQRGTPSLIEKNIKADIALKNNIDLVIELPFIYATQSADIFASGAIQILNKLNVDYLVFGSESNNVELLKNIAQEQLNSDIYNEKVKKYLNDGLNYPTAMAKASSYKDLDFTKNPNDLLALSYIKAIIETGSNIKPISIERTNSFHSLDLTTDIVSASAIRNALIEKKDTKKFVPLETYNELKNNVDFDYFKYLKYKIITEKTSISKYLTVDEGIENRIIKVINECNSTEELINKIKTKRYTYNKISRMLIHILCSITKEEATSKRNIEYIRVLRFNKKGQIVLNKIKKELNIPLITTTKYYNDLLEIENRADEIYKLIRL